LNLSVIIVNYNVKHFLEQCLISVEKALEKIDSEIIVVDNNSVDGSINLIKDKFSHVNLIANEKNTGFAVANNQAIKIAKKCIPDLYAITDSIAASGMKDGGYKFANVEIEKNLEPIEIGKSNLVIKKDSEIIILNFGALMDISKNIAEKLDSSLADMRFVKPLDTELLKKIKDRKLIITIEDGSRYGGAGSAVQEWYADNNLNVTIKSFGIPDEFIEHASRDEMIKMASLNEDAVMDQIKKLI